MFQFGLRLAGSRHHNRRRHHGDASSASL